MKRRELMVGVSGARHTAACCSRRDFCLPSVDDCNGLDLYEPLRQRQRRDTNEGARWRRARKEGRPRLADESSMLGFIIHDVSRDLHDVGVARTGCGEG